MNVKNNSNIIILFLEYEKRANTAYLPWAKEFLKAGRHTQLPSVHSVFGKVQQGLGGCTAQRLDVFLHTCTSIV